MAELKTKPTAESVESLLAGIEDPERRKDCRRLLKMMRELTGEKPKMWGGSIVGFGTWHYVYESGREGDWFLTGFSPRKKSLTLYIMTGFERYDGLMSRLGKYTTGKSCLYVKRLSDVDENVLRELITDSLARMRRS